MLRDDMEARARGIETPVDLVGWDVLRDPILCAPVDTLGGLDAPTRGLLDPVFARATSIVAGIPPEQLHAWQLSAYGLIQDQFDPISVHDVRGVHVDDLHESLGIDQDVPLASNECFRAIIASSRAPRRRWCSSPIDCPPSPHWAPDVVPSAGARVVAAWCGSVATFHPAASGENSDSPSATVATLVAEAPGAARAQLVENGIEDSSVRVETRASNERLRRQEWLKQCPFSVRQVGGVAVELSLHVAAYLTPLPARHPFADSFSADTSMMNQAAC